MVYFYTSFITPVSDDKEKDSSRNVGFFIDICDHLDHCIQRSENFMFHTQRGSLRWAIVLAPLLSLDLRVMQSLSGFNTVALRGGSRMARPCRSGKIRSRK
jgi:hypothetical protein